MLKPLHSESKIYYDSLSVNFTDKIVFKSLMILVIDRTEISKIAIDEILYEQFITFLW